VVVRLAATAYSRLLAGILGSVKIRTLYIGPMSWLIPMVAAVVIRLIIFLIPTRRQSIFEE
jgi:hypothetical protein